MDQAQDQAQDSGPVITNLASSGHVRTVRQSARPAHARKCASKLTPNWADLRKLLSLLHLGLSYIFCVISWLAEILSRRIIIAQMTLPSTSPWIPGPLILDREAL